MKKIVILYSSGLDSKIMLHYAKVNHPNAEIKCIYYKHGADSEEGEIKLLPDFVEIRSVDWLGEKIKPVAKLEDPFAGAIYIPGRNLVFSTLAACQELADEIWMGTLADECNPKGTDKNEEFRKGTSDLLTYVLSPFKEKVVVRFPFVEENWTKADSVKWALENGLAEEEIKSTISCWHFSKTPCGECKQCFKRQLVFRLNDLTEICEKDPIESEFGRNLISGYLKEVYVNKTTNADEVNVSKMITDLYCRENSLFSEKTKNIIKTYL